MEPAHVFDSVFETLRFAIEDMPASMLRGFVLEVEDARYNGQQVWTFYEADAYPLPRWDMCNNI